LTELQGGRIGVSSIPGQGSTFKFYLKARRAKSLEQTAHENAQKLEKLVVNAETSAKVPNSTLNAVKTLTSPNYINVLNRRHSSRSNPIIGSPVNPDTLHVLIVEDNLINQKVSVPLPLKLTNQTDHLQVMATQLRKAKCVVHVADHGADAILFLKGTTFSKGCGPNATPLSIVLMDLEMPIMDGLTAVRKIREMQNSGELTRPVPVIAVSLHMTDQFHS
jgi:CheY-like chemotaxis protein